MPAATHQALDPENPDILFGSTSSLWSASHPIEWGIKRIAALGLQGIEPYAGQIEDHRANPLALKEKFDKSGSRLTSSTRRRRPGRSPTTWHSPVTSFSRAVATSGSATWALARPAVRRQTS